MSTADLDRVEHLAAARFDTRSLRLIAGEFVDEDLVPAPSDIPEEDWR